MSRLPVMCLMLIVGALVSGPRVLESRAAEPAQSNAVARQESARAQLDHATVMKRALRGKRGEARDLARKNAVEGYRAVRRYWPRDRALASEASFRAGELLRSAAANDSALSEFGHAQDYGKDCEFRARAGLEIGHIHRRLGRTMAALAAYEAVEALGETWATQRDKAAYWQGRAQLSLQRPLDARRCFERAATSGVDPMDRIRAYDAWCDLLITAQDLEGAAGVLEQCRKGLEEYAAQKTAQGGRVRAALDAMRSPGRLTAAVTARHRQRFAKRWPSTRMPPP